MKFRILPIAASLVFAARFLHAEPVPAPVAEAPKPAPAVEPAKPAEPKKTAELPPPKPLGNEVGKGLAWLAKAQNSDGGWGQGGGWRVNRQEGQGGRLEGDQIPDPSDIGNTAIALQAFLRAGTKLDSGEHSQVAAKAAAFLLTRLEADKEDSLYVTTVRDTQLQSKIGAYVDTFLAAQILSELKDRLPDPADEQRQDGFGAAVPRRIVQRREPAGRRKARSAKSATDDVAGRAEGTGAPAVDVLGVQVGARDDEPLDDLVTVVVRRMHQGGVPIPPAARRGIAAGVSPDQRIPLALGTHPRPAGMAGGPGGSR